MTTKDHTCAEDGDGDGDEDGDGDGDGVGMGMGMRMGMGIGDLVPVNGEYLVTKGSGTKV